MFQIFFKKIGPDPPMYMCVTQSLHSQKGPHAHGNWQTALGCAQSELKKKYDIGYILYLMGTRLSLCVFAENKFVTEAKR